MTDEQRQIQEILEGNKQAFSELIDKYKRLVSHIVNKIVKTNEDRQDLCQDVFIKVYQNLESFKGDCKLSSWIGRIAYNASLNHMGKKKPELWDDLSPEMSLDSQPNFELLLDEVIANNDLVRKISKEIQLLPSPYNVIVALYHLDDMTYQEIAEITGLPDGTVKSYLFRARRLLRERLSKKYWKEDLKQCGT